MKIKLYRAKLNTASIYLTICCCFFIPFSSSLMGATAIAAFVFWLLSGNISSLPTLIKQNPAILFALLLFSLLTVGLFYSPIPLDEAAPVLKKYRELLFFVMAVSLFQGDPQKCGYAENAFIAGCILLLSLSYLMYFGIIPVEKYGYSTVYHITHSFFMAILAFWCLQRFLDSKKYRFVWFFFLLLACINLFYIAPGRTGMIVFIALALLSLLQKLSPKKSLLAVAILIILLTVSFLTSENFGSRIKLAVTEIQNYQTHETESRTSLGMRFDWWANSIVLIKQKPIFGHGTGSFNKVQAGLIETTKTKSTDNPHNEYLLIAVQSGLAGLALFIVFLATLLMYSFKLKDSKKHLLQGVVIAMASGCIMNSFLFDSHQGHFFTILSAILYATRDQTAVND